MTHYLHFDGASQHNPGSAGAGFVITRYDKSGNAQVIKEDAIPLGTATNNVAEYQALLHGLRAATELGIRDLRVRGDSRLVVMQVLDDVLSQGRCAASGRSKSPICRN